MQDESEEDRSRDDKSPRDDVSMTTLRHDRSPEASPGPEPSDGVGTEGGEDGSLRLEESKDLESDTLQVNFDFQNFRIFSCVQTLRLK